VLVADFAIVVAVAIVETGLAHAALHGAHNRQHPPVGTKWQSCAATRDLDGTMMFVELAADFS
jgi:hypothetical protein